MLISFIALLSSCKEDAMEGFFRGLVKSPISTIERDVRGHEQIYKVQAILRVARKSKDNNFFISYDISNFPPDFPLYQEIMINKDEKGNMSITSERKVFDVMKGKDLYYTLELRYYDLNNAFINHQFAGYYEDDIANSTLPVHQHFFTIQTYALNGYPLTYPMTLDSIYIDKYLYQLDESGQRIESTITSPSSIYAPKDTYVPNSLPYNKELALKASSASSGKDIGKEIQDPTTGKTMKLYRTNDPSTLNELTEKLFHYEYRDTDPVDEYFGNRIITDDLGRTRYDTPVQRLRKRRSLNQGENYDALGMKGALRFFEDNVTFQMRVCICHIIAAQGKYDMLAQPGGVHYYNQISSGWNSFDIDFPLPFRVIADIDADEATWLPAIQKYYKKATAEQVRKALDVGSYYPHNPTIKM